MQRIGYGFIKLHSSVAVKSFSTAKIIHQIPGTPREVSSKNVQLRGTLLKGKYNDLPNLIWFGEACDPVSSWINFFTNPENNILDQRNVWLLYPRNFGTSDRSDTFDMEEMANDVARFMWENKISTATLGGHGFGGKLALATGCYHSSRVTGVINLDTAPLDHRYHEAFREFKGFVKTFRDYEPHLASLKDNVQFLQQKISCPKWRSIFTSNLTVNPTNSNRSNVHFDIEALNHNLQFNKADSIGNWSEKYGLWGGRYINIFPEYSRWVFLNTNTMPILKVCIKAKGFGQDIFYIQGDENPLNHWIYDFKQQSFVAARKIEKFLGLYDGVHTLLQDRSEINKYFVPDVKNSRKDNDYYYSDYTPTHVHHNWRYNDIYGQQKEK